jgi:hypothetical protein
MADYGRKITAFTQKTSNKKIKSDYWKKAVSFWCSVTLIFLNTIKSIRNDFNYGLTTIKQSGQHQAIDDNYLIALMPEVETIPKEQ